MTTHYSVTNIPTDHLSISPVVLDDFFVRRDNHLTLGTENHKYLVEDYFNKPVMFDLKHGYSTYDPRPMDESLNVIMSYLGAVADRRNNRNLKLLTNNADVVCNRSCLKELASSPYENKGNGWRYLVEKFEQTLFLAEMETEKKKLYKACASESDKKATYGGHKFESYLFAKRGQIPTLFEPVSTWDTMYAAFATTFPANYYDKELKVMYKGEIDGLDSRGNRVEVKTQPNKLFNNTWFPQKAMKWWLQNKLANINEIIVGYKTDDVVHRLEKVNLEILRQQCEHVESWLRWNGNACLRAAQRILNAVRDNYDKLVRPGELLVIERVPDSRIVQFRTISAVFSRNQVLTEEFKAKFKSY